PSLSQRLDKSRAEFPPARSGDQAYLFQAVVEFLLRLPGTPPLLLFVDNLQWADEARLQLFHFAARQIPRSNALLIGAFRAEELDENAALQTLLRDLQRNPLAHLRLPPFTLELILDLMAKLWPELPPGYRTHIGSMLMQATGGNPLF